ncbi:MAG: hypothetical protein QOI24_1092 [Acidobacteriota bacterium]|jgi:hypothetical protein|nr:hypothetical protein [Acidobacteriota bacterium]
MPPWHSSPVSWHGMTVFTDRPVGITDAVKEVRRYLLTS